MREAFDARKNDAGHFSWQDARRLSCNHLPCHPSPCNQPSNPHVPASKLRGPYEPWCIFLATSYHSPKKTYTHQTMMKTKAYTPQLHIVQMIMSTFGTPSIQGSTGGLVVTGAYGPDCCAQTSSPLSNDPRSGVRYFPGEFAVLL